ncbi:hypothetical protein B0H15DRAFT_954516 [Mycena belliarum]|uniref:Uncharacterized protein n=1 Tax=Mycena belliarum TaxID=1033014 RepID=A0AAD6TV25_9AGAR|nr:hypothetical protein B0H15DRAFT_954516 [Mycena belliae]
MTRLTIKRKFPSLAQVFDHTPPAPPGALPEFSQRAFIAQLHLEFWPCPWTCAKMRMPAIKREHPTAAAVRDGERLSAIGNRARFSLSLGASSIWCLSTVFLHIHLYRNHLTQVSLSITSYLSPPDSE